MLHPDEEATIRAFIVPPRRPRYLEQMESPNRRDSFLDRLNHCPDLDERFTTLLASGADVIGELSSRGAPAMCRVISCVSALDGKEMELRAAIEAAEAAGWGTIISCIPGQLAFYLDECGERRVILERPSQ